MREVQTESVACAVSAALGLDTSGHSFGYVASGAVGKTDEEMRACLQMMRGAAKVMVENLQAVMVAWLKAPRETPDARHGECRPCTQTAPRWPDPKYVIRPSHHGTSARPY